MQKELIHTTPFILTSFIKLKNPNEPLTIYIEGDGFAWASRNRISSDPTPIHPVALKLARLDNSPNVAYLARPCQYEGRQDKSCHKKYWASHRFAPEVITSMNQAIQKLKNKSGAKKINLVGFSGGAAVAVLVAAQRDDIASIRTVAGNLDHVALHNHHSVTHMPSSLNPADIASQIAHIPQLHFIGRQDKIVPEAVSSSYLKRSTKTQCIKIEKANASHVEGWGNLWQELLEKQIPCIE